MAERFHQPVDSFSRDSCRLGLVKPKGGHWQESKRDTTRNGDPDDNP
jgi:hypothetical protein